MSATLPVRPRRAVIVGAGFGGLSLGIRLQSMGFETLILERLDGPGGRGYQKKVGGYTFDMGPTVITVPHFLEELFALERGKPNLDTPDFPAEVLHAPRVTAGHSGGPRTSQYVQLVPILPFYRILFADGTFFDYDGDPESTHRQILALAPEDLAGYDAFHKAAKDIFERGFLQLGYTYFGDIATMLAAVPDLLKLDAVRPLFSLVKQYFKSDKMRQVFSFEPLLIGGSPLRVPALYAMIHFVETTWGIHYAMGGTGALVRGLAQKLQELGGTIRYSAGVNEILVTDDWGKPPSLTRPKMARGVVLENGERIPADLVVSNGDWANTYLKRIPAAARLVNSDLRIKAARQSMSLLVVYFGFKDDGQPLNLKHHNIILGPRYEDLLTEIFDTQQLGADFSQYLHVPTLTDPSLAPAGHHAAYTLVPMPHNGSGINWNIEAPKLVARVYAEIEQRGLIPNLRARLTHSEYITPDYFAHTLDSYLGNAFGPQPLLMQSAYLRPHNRSEDIQNLYLVGAGTQPGAGTPSVLMSAKMTARLIYDDWQGRHSPPTTT